MIPPDSEIYEVEKRIAARRHCVEQAARETGRQALKTLTSPWTLAGVGLVGFLAAGGLRRNGDPRHVERRRFDKKHKRHGAAAGGLASAALAVASWFIRSQFGSPVAMAQYFLARMRRPASSPRGDRTQATTRTPAATVE